MTLVLERVSPDLSIRQLQRNARPVPAAVELGADLTTTTSLQFALAVARPLTVIALYCWASLEGHWKLAVMLVPILFLADVVVVHDLMHHNLSRSKRTNHVSLTILAALMLESGHALEATHAEHHRSFPSKSDPEAYLATWPIWRVLIEGPIYRYKLWYWALRHGNGSRVAAVAAEAMLHFAVVGAAIAASVTGGYAPFTVFVATGIVSSWFFPIVSVTGVHNARAKSQFQQSRTLRGVVVPRAMLGMGYHLEHHLWPMIPSHHLNATAQRCNLILRNNNAAITKTF